MNKKSEPHEVSEGGTKEGADYWEKRNAMPKQPAGDEHLGKFVFCTQHHYAHSTGWCTVRPEDKVPLKSETHEEAIKEAAELGLS